MDGFICVTVGDLISNTIYCILDEIPCATNALLSSINKRTDSFRNRICNFASCINDSGEDTLRSFLYFSAKRILCFVFFILVFCFLFIFFISLLSIFLHLIKNILVYAKSRTNVLQSKINQMRLADKVVYIAYRTVDCCYDTS